MTQLLARDPRAPFDLPAPLGEPDQARRARYDWVLNGTALALGLIGALLVWAATRDVERAAGNNPNGYLYRHLINFALATGMMFGASHLNARMLRRSGPFVYVAGLLGLMLVLV